MDIIALSLREKQNLLAGIYLYSCEYHFSTDLDRNRGLSLQALKKGLSLDRSVGTLTVVLWSDFQNVQALRFDCY